MADASALAAIPLFASLSEDDRAIVASWFETKTVGEGTRLCGEGATGYSFFLLADGSADVTAGGETLGRLGPGDFFGEMAILGDGRCTATVTATGPSTIHVMFGTEFRRLQQAHPDVAAEIEAAVRERIAVRP
jgi:CRP-like cAMP-binding protein